MAYLTGAWPLWAFAALTVAVTALGIVAAEYADRSWGTHDSGRIVIDEVAGYFFTVALVDRHSAAALVAGFVLFRAFDIIKPPPIRAVDEKLGGGLGVVLDDVVAGIMAGAVMVGLDYYEAFAAADAWLATVF